MFHNRKLASTSETMQLVSDLIACNATICRFADKIEAYHGDDCILRGQKAGFGYVLLYSDRVIPRQGDARAMLAV